MIDDRYELLEIIGSGGMATVWKAHDRTLDRMVAIKRLSPRLAADPRSATRFQREARAAARLSHPGIVTVFDTGEDGDGPYIIEELVEGDSLADILRVGPLAPSVVARLVAQAAEALDHAHAHGVVHRDVKPANLIVEADGTVRLTDFGIASLLDDETTLTDESGLVGTLVYVAPELFEGERPTPASDIYSLGAVTHEMLAGQPPFGADHVGGTITAIREGDVAPLEVDAGVGAAVAAAMSTDPARRPKTASAFATAMVGGMTLPLDLAALIPTTGSPASEASGGPTTPLPEPRLLERGRLWAWVLPVAIVLGVGFIAAFANWNDPGETKPPGSTAMAATTTSTSSISTTRVATPPATSDVIADTPDEVAALIVSALEDLDPPEYKPKDVRAVDDALSDLMSAWLFDEDVSDSYQALRESVGRLDESPQVNELLDLTFELARLLDLHPDENEQD